MSDINFNNIYLKINNTKISIAQHRSETDDEIVVSEVAMFNKNGKAICISYPFTTVKELRKILQIIENGFAD